MLLRCQKHTNVQSFIKHLEKIELSGKTNTKNLTFEKPAIRNKFEGTNDVACTHADPTYRANSVRSQYIPRRRIQCLSLARVHYS